MGLVVLNFSHPITLEQLPKFGAKRQGFDLDAGKA